jgi:hypothetical protein
MYSWRNFIDKFKRYGKLERGEKIGLFITIIILGFMFSFRNWGVETFDLQLGLQNFFLITIFVAISFFVHEMAHRTIALWLGYRSQYKMWLLGLIIGLVVAFVSNGRLLFLATGALVITHLEIHRLGKGYYELSLKHLGWIAMSGAIANMIFAVILKSLAVALSSPLLEKAVMINIWIALYDMLPIPPYNGSRTFFGSRFIYVFVVGALIGCAALLTFFTGILPLIGAIVLGALILFVFFVYVDKRWLAK